MKEIPGRFVPSHEYGLRGHLYEAAIALLAFLQDTLRLLAICDVSYSFDEPSRISSTIFEKRGAEFCDITRAIFFQKGVLDIVNRACFQSASYILGDAGVVLASQR